MVILSKMISKQADGTFGLVSAKEIYFCYIAPGEWEKTNSRVSAMVAASGQWHSSIGFRIRVSNTKIQVVWFLDQSTAPLNLGNK